MEPKIDYGIIQKNHLLISGQTWVAEINSIFSASGAKHKCDTKDGTIVLAEVIHGFIPQSDKVTITSEGITLASDEIARLEIDHQPVERAEANAKVGICLTNTKLKAIKQALNKLN